MPDIRVKNNEVSYNFSFEQKYLFIRGDSGVGKSTLLQLIDDYNTNPDAIICEGNTSLRVLHSINDLQDENNIFFLDENMPLLSKSDCASLLNESNNYFVIITRSRKFNGLKTGLDSMVTMIAKSDGSHTISPIYPKAKNLTCIADTIVCEDANSGKIFLEKVLDCKIETAGSKDRLWVTLRKLNKKEYTVVYDRAGISFSYEDQLNYIKRKGIDIVSEIDWDSFEAYVLESPEYGMTIKWYPDKEQNATNIMKELFPGYNKSSLPEGMKIPVYWKVKEAKELLENEAKVKKIDSF